MSFHTCFRSKRCLSGAKHSSRFMSDIELRSYGCKYASMFSLSIMSKSLQPHGLYLARVLCSQDFPNLGIEPMSHELAEGFFSTEPPRKFGWYKY